MQERAMEKRHSERESIGRDRRASGVPSTPDPRWTGNRRSSDVVPYIVMKRSRIDRVEVRGAALVRLMNKRERAPRVKPTTKAHHARQQESKHVNGLGGRAYPGADSTWDSRGQQSWGACLAGQQQQQRCGGLETGRKGRSRTGADDKLVRRRKGVAEGRKGSQFRPDRWVRNGQPTRPQAPKPQAHKHPEPRCCAQRPCASLSRPAHLTT